MKVSIVIPTYNHCQDFLVPCLESIKKFTDLSQVEVLVVANECIDNTREYVTSLGEPFKLIWFDEGLGYTKATNAGIRASIGEFIVLLNNDVVLLEQKPNNWIERLLEPFEKNDKMGIVGPHYLRDPNTDSDFVVFFCVMVRKQVFRDVGLLDEVFSPGAGEDTDLCLRAKLHGYEVGYTNVSSPSETQEFCVGDFPIYHKGEGTFGNYSGWNEIFERNSKLLRDRKASGYYDKIQQITKNKPKVSVIVTSYNYGRFLDECLTSIRNQTFKNYELIVVDDGSNDNTIDAAQRYSPDKLIRLETRSRTVTANNTGIQASSGEYICLVNADDTIDAEYLGKCVAALDKDPLCAIAYSDFWHFGGGLDNGVYFQEYSYEALRKFNYILGSAMFRRKAYDEVGGFSMEMDLGWEDYDLWISICERGWTAVRVPGYLYRYRNHGANRTVNMDYGPLLEKLKERHKEKPVEVTATICTRGRYFTTLPLAINAIIQQTYKPKGLIIFDDGEHKDLREIPVYQNLLKLLYAKGIGWEVKWTPQHGQVINHNFALNYITTDWIWRVDDDEIPEPDVLEKLVAKVTPEVGAVAGLVFDPKNMFGESKAASNKIEDIYYGFNIQWFKQTEVKEVDHLYSTFLYRRAAGRHGYQTDLSPAGHREETLFSYGMRRKGYKLLVVPDAVTWHIREPQGGIRTHTQSSYWEHDEQIFHNKLHDWGIAPRDTKFVVLNCGLGDHIIFKSLWRELKEKYPNSRFIIAACYSEVFEGLDAEIVSIAEAESVLGSETMLKHNAYRKAWALNHTGHLKEVYRKMYVDGDLS
jgi:glycosyltransferase involved in cell wall biosynthesis